MSHSDSLPTKDHQREVINAVLDALFYDDGLRRPLTRATNKLIEETKLLVDESYALFLDELTSLSSHQFPSLLVEAEKKGCQHPLLYIHLGDAYAGQHIASDTASSKASEYYCKAIGRKTF